MQFLSESERARPDSVDPWLRGCRSSDTRRGVVGTTLCLACNLTGTATSRCGCFFPCIAECDTEQYEQVVCKPRTAVTAKKDASVYDFRVLCSCEVRDQREKEASEAISDSVHDLTQVTTVIHLSRILIICRTACLHLSSRDQWYRP